MGIPYEKQRKSGALDGFSAAWPLLFMSFAQEAVGVACSLFGTQNVLTVTGGRGVSWRFRFCMQHTGKAGSRGSTEKACAGAEHGSDTAGWQGAVHRSAAAPRHLFAGCVLSSGQHRCMPVPERALQFLLPQSLTDGTAHGRPYAALLWLYWFW